jgi:UDP-N-acetylmuramoyl-tripeptide--D-alanyl-D-alanine ligase
MTTDALYDLFYNSSGICTDTRNIKEDCLFLCLKGENFNGNSFAEKALLLGAKYVILDDPAYKTNENQFLVSNVLLFLQNLAYHHRRQFDIPVIGITGSNGKTSTKELINVVLSKKYKVLATQGNLNNHIGVPLTLLQLKEFHDIAIIEMGANKFKDIEELCLIAEPNYGIITNIGKAHLEGFKNYEGVLQTKLELYQSIKKNGGELIVNSDDPVLTDNVPVDTIVNTYGQKSTALVQGRLVQLTPFVELEWHTDQFHSGPVTTQMIGKYNFYNFLAAICMGTLFKVDPKKINEAISEYTPENNRSQVKKTLNNTLILDCYNANPTSMESALESFSMIDHPRKFFIIGDMLELGEEAPEEHEKIIALAEKMNLEGCVIGPLFCQIEKNNYPSFASIAAAEKYFQDQPKKGNLILLKGSRGIGLEKLEEQL